MGSWLHLDYILIVVRRPKQGYLCAINPLRIYEQRARPAVLRPRAVPRIPTTAVVWSSPTLYCSSGRYCNRPISSSILPSQYEPRYMCILYVYVQSEKCCCVAVSTFEEEGVIVIDHHQLRTCGTSPSVTRVIRSRLACANPRGIKNSLWWEMPRISTRNPLFFSRKIIVFHPLY